jgi:hypothetical protein
MNLFNMLFILLSGERLGVSLFFSFQRVHDLVHRDLKGKVTVQQIRDVFPNKGNRLPHSRGGLFVPILVARNHRDLFTNTFQGSDEWQGRPSPRKEILSKRP